MEKKPSGAISVAWSGAHHLVQRHICVTLLLLWKPQLHSAAIRHSRRHASPSLFCSVWFKASSLLVGWKKISQEIYGKSKRRRDTWPVQHSLTEASIWQHNLAVRLYNLSWQHGLLLQKRKLKPCFPRLQRLIQSGEISFPQWQQTAPQRPPCGTSHLQVTSRDLGKKGLLSAARPPETWKSSDPQVSPPPAGTGVDVGVGVPQLQPGFGGASHFGGKATGQKPVWSLGGPT